MPLCVCLCGHIHACMCEDLCVCMGVLVVCACLHLCLHEHCVCFKLHKGSKHFLQPDVTAFMFRVFISSVISCKLNFISSDIFQGTGWCWISVFMQCWGICTLLPSTAITHSAFPFVSAMSRLKSCCFWLLSHSWQRLHSRITLAAFSYIPGSAPPSSVHTASNSR